MLHRIVRHVIENEFGVSAYELAIHFIEPATMAAMNQHYLQHEGSTDIITFDYGFREAWSDEVRCDSRAHLLSGELFISVSDAVKQAREFGTTWQSEIVRYVIHGLLHLQGFDDLHPAKRREMKREENRLVKVIESRFAIEQLARTRNPKPKTRNSRSRERT